MLAGGAYATGAQPAFVVLADVNDDGQFDIIAANTGDGTMSVLYGNGAGHFAPAITLVAGVRPAGIATGDFDGDGAVDIAKSDTAAAERMPRRR